MISTKVNNLIFILIFINSAADIFAAENDDILMCYSCSDCVDDSLQDSQLVQCIPPEAGSTTQNPTTQDESTSSSTDQSASTNESSSTELTTQSPVGAETSTATGVTSSSSTAEETSSTNAVSSTAEEATSTAVTSVATSGDPESTTAPSLTSEASTPATAVSSIEPSSTNAASTTAVEASSTTVATSAAPESTAAPSLTSEPSTPATAISTSESSATVSSIEPSSTNAASSTAVDESSTALPTVATSAAPESTAAPSITSEPITSATSAPTLSSSESVSETSALVVSTAASATTNAPELEADSFLESANNPNQNELIPPVVDEAALPILTNIAGISENDSEEVDALDLDRRKRSINDRSVFKLIQNPAEYLVSRYSGAHIRRLKRAVNSEGTSAHCFKVQVKNGDNTEVNRGCVIVPLEKSACEVLEETYGVGNVESCKVCPTDRCNLSTAVHGSWSFITLTLMITIIRQFTNY